MTRYHCYYGTAGFVVVSDDKPQHASYGDWLGVVEADDEADALRQAITNMTPDPDSDEVPA